MGLNPRFLDTTMKLELPGRVTVDDSLCVRGKISFMTPPLSSFTASFSRSGRFLLLRWRQQSPLPLKFVNLSELKGCHPNPLPPLRDPDQGRKDQLLNNSSRSQWGQIP
jgi:hypothetical protein